MCECEPTPDPNSQGGCLCLQEAEFLACDSLSDEVLLTLGDVGRSPLLTSRGIQGGCPRLR